MGLVGRRKGQAMLVDTIKLGKFPQAKLTSAVRLYLIENERCQLGDGYLYRSLVLGFRYYVIPRFANWQRHLVIAGNCDHDVVERGSQVVNRIPDNQRDAGWKLCDSSRLDALLSGLEIILNDQGCEVRVQEGAVLSEKLADAALGPLGL
jgi:hypothetical protein